MGGWPKLGFPRSLQGDDEGSCLDSNRHPRSFGLCIRFCLYLGMAVVFIPAREPWRHGIIERFHQVYDQLCWRSQTCRDWAHLAAEWPGFEAFHHTQRRYATLGQRTPWEVHDAYRRRALGVSLHSAPAGFPVA